jgi:hypothetical protein
MRRRPDLVMEVPIHDLDDEGDPVDIDTVADLAGAGAADTPSSL